MGRDARLKKRKAAKAKREASIKRWKFTPTPLQKGDRWHWVFYVCEPGECFRLPDGHLLRGTLTVAKCCEDNSKPFLKVQSERLSDDEIVADLKMFLEGDGARIMGGYDGFRLFRVRAGKLKELPNPFPFREKIHGAMRSAHALLAGKR